MKTKWAPILWLMLAAVIIGASIGFSARAEALPPGCVSQPWWRGEALRQTVRIICDGPRQPDGSWMRAREFWAPGYMASATSYCSGGIYYSSCTYNPPYWVPVFDILDTYPVTDGTVLGDEPGYVS
jgi:hypothetical protein